VVNIFPFVLDMASGFYKIPIHPDSIEKSNMSFLRAPSRIKVDQGRSFVSNKFREFCSTNRIELFSIATDATCETCERM